MPHYFSWQRESAIRRRGVACLGGNQAWKRLHLYSAAMRFVALIVIHAGSAPTEHAKCTAH